ncbi:MAG: DUF6358 family protein [Daejeonella sp.]
MAKKIALNVLFNIAIIVLGLTLVWAFKNSLYLYAIISVFGLIVFIILKIKLVKSVRELAKKDNHSLQK